jgi:YggT family protein
MNAILNLLNQIVFLINLALFIYVVLDVLMHFDIVNRHNALVQRVHGTLGKLLEPLLAPIRRLLGKYLPQIPFDISPVILILLLNFLIDLLYEIFWSVPVVG